MRRVPFVIASILTMIGILLECREAIVLAVILYSIPIIKENWGGA